MEISSVARRSYDHRLKNSVACSRNSNLFPELAIPKRTTSRWASGVRLSVVTASEFSESPAVRTSRKKGMVTVSYHSSNDDLHPKTAASIFREAGLNPKDSKK